MKKRVKRTSRGWIDWDHYLLQLKWGERYTMAEIARRLGVTWQSVQAAMKKRGIPSLPREERC